jgi:NAD(P)-dependent dehydrogenase (short-subunit alcohol dehydrogenase family)
MVDFEGRIAVVSGGGSGIGAACTRRLRHEGATVVVWDLLDAEGGLHCDVTAPASVDAALARTVAECGTPSVHVAAAGIRGWPRPFHEVDAAQFDRTIEINLRGVFLTMRAITAAMRADGLDGSIVAVSSVAGQITDPGQTAYSAAKAGVNHLCRVAASDLGADGIRINAVAPGPTATPMLARLTADSDYIAEVEAVTPLGRLGTPDLIADAIIAVMRADWITGQVITADGGIGLQTARGRWRLPNASRSPHAAPLEIQ